jgi:hypothetical protein
MGDFFAKPSPIISEEAAFTLEDFARAFPAISHAIARQFGAMHARIA